MTTIPEQRRRLFDQMIGIPPRLWCPPLTHYTADGQLDRGRISAHWRFMTASVKGFLVPGSTGDGWEMTSAEQLTIIDAALELCSLHKSVLLIGALKPDLASIREAILTTLDRLKSRARVDDPINAMKANRVCAFVVCAPRGAELTQAQIHAALENILSLGFPTALYQLPQITQNKISPETVAQLAARHANLLLFKDSSGNDEVALADRGRGGLFLTRGAEGHYARWLHESGGPYQGLLLSTANCFPAQLRSVIELVASGRNDAAAALSDRLTRVVERVFATVTTLPHGNAFTNTNKAIDHFMAHGAGARLIAPPRLHAGTHIPPEVISRAGEALEAEELMPQAGYLR